jgi:hypothetical protein
VRNLEVREGPGRFFSAGAVDERKMDVDDGPIVVSLCKSKDGAKMDECH